MSPNRIDLTTLCLIKYLLFTKSRRDPDSFIKISGPLLALPAKTQAQSSVDSSRLDVVLVQRNFVRYLLTAAYPAKHQPSWMNRMLLILPVCFRYFYMSSLQTQCVNINACNSWQRCSFGLKICMFVR